jgi:hypothetical protein
VFELALNVTTAHANPDHPRSIDELIEEAERGRERVRLGTATG